jgi:hypothetical protein
VAELGEPLTACVWRRQARPVAEGRRWARRPDPPRFHRVLLEAGFTEVRVATETPFNYVFEAR